MNQIYDCLSLDLEANNFSAEHSIGFGLKR